MIELKHISKSYFTDKKETVSSNISYQFFEGKSYAILGDSGCGKTTLLNIIGGFDKDYSGEVLFDGKTIHNYSSKKMDELHNLEIGYISQNAIHFEKLTLNDNVLLPNYRGRYKRNILSNKNFYKAKVSTLSGGEKQRLTFIRSLINHPQVVLADEPTGSLDEGNKEVVMSQLVEIAKGKILIFVTHDQDMANKYADVILQMRNGKICSSKQNESKPIYRNNLDKKKSKFMVFTLALKSMLTDLPRLISFVNLFLTGLMCIAISFSISDGIMAFFKEEFESEMNTNVISVEKKDDTITYFELENVAKEEYFDYFLFCPDGYPGIVYNESFKDPILNDLNISGIEEPIYYGIYDNEIDVNEVCLSSSLFEALNSPKTININTIIEDKPCSVSLSIKEIIPDETYYLYQNESWIYHFLVDIFKVSQTKMRTKTGYLFIKQEVEYFYIEPILKEKYEKLIFTSSIDELMQPLYEIMDQIKLVFLVFASISILISFFAVIVITYLDIYDHKRQIKLLRTLGWSRNNIKKYFITEQIMRGIITFCIQFTISRTIMSFVNYILRLSLNIEKNILFHSERTTIIVFFVVFLTILFSTLISTRSVKSTQI